MYSNNNMARWIFVFVFKTIDRIVCVVISTEVFSSESKTKKKLLPVSKFVIVFFFLQIWLGEQILVVSERVIAQ